MESRGPNMSLPEQLVEERAISPGLATAQQVMAEFPVPMTWAPPPPRMMGYRQEPTITEVLATGGVEPNDFAGHTASVRNHISMPY